MFNLKMNKENVEPKRSKIELKVAIVALKTK